MAVTVTWEDVKNTAIDIIDELDDFTQAQQDLVLDHAEDWVRESRFITVQRTFDARRYYAAHIASMAINPPAGEGTQSSVGIDAFSSGVTLAVNNPKPEENILSTVYGREYKRLERSVFQTMFVG